MSLTAPLLLLSILLLSACSSTPSTVQLSPQLTPTNMTQQVKGDHSWLLSSQDMRTERYLIAISSGNDVATLINESSSSRAIIEKTLQTHWLKQGLTFSNRSTSTSNNGSANSDNSTSRNTESYHIDIQLIKLLAQVEQSAINHESDINVIIKIQLRSDTRTFSKTFRSHYQEKALFSANTVTLAEQLNTQLSQLLDQIVQDPELNAKLLKL
ncbi:MAG: YajG family lipoprotein [Psychromonas sp.]